MSERVGAGLALFSMIISLVLYFLPRRLSTKGVKVVEKVLHPGYRAVVPVSLIVLGSSLLLILLGYQKQAELLPNAYLVLMTIIIPVMFGYWAANAEISNREWAEREKRWEEEKARKEELT